MKLDGKTTQELLEMDRKLTSDPDNQQEGLWRYNEKTRKKLDEIRLQIAYNVRMGKLARGVKIDDSGYSGRQTKRRR